MPNYVIWNGGDIIAFALIVLIFICFLCYGCCSIACEKSTPAHVEVEDVEAGGMAVKEEDHSDNGSSGNDSNSKEDVV